MLALTFALTIIMFLSKQVFHIFLLGLPLVITSLSSFIQIISKKYFHKKVFRIAPLHHHFQAIGWGNDRIVMRYWIVSLMLSITGIIISLSGQMY